MKKFVFLMLVMSLIVAFALPVQSADFPKKNLQGIVMWGAGGATDNVARAITPHVEPLLGKKIVLINKPGGAGAISTQYVYSRPTDGYTLLYGAENPQVHGILNLSKIDYNDFYPINILGRSVPVIIANIDTPWNSFEELIEDAKKNPGKIKMGSTGPGGLAYTIGALVKAVTDIDVISVPFDGEGPGVTAMLGGHVDFMSCGLTSAREHIRAGRVKVLAVVSDKSVLGMEEFPLVTKNFPGFKKYLPWGPFYGVFCKRNVPNEVKAILIEAFKNGASEEKFQSFIRDIGSISMNIHGEEADRFLKHFQSVTTWLLYGAGGAKISPAELNIPKP